MTADADGPCPQVTVVAAEQGEVSAALETASDAPLLGMVAGPLDTAAVRASAPDRVGRSVVVAKTIDVVAVPTPLVDALGWGKTRPDWRAVAEAVLDTDAWSALVRADLGDFEVAMGDPARSAPAASAMASLVATTLGQSTADLTPRDLGDERAQGTLLALDRVAGVRTASTAPNPADIGRVFFQALSQA